MSPSWVGTDPGGRHLQREHFRAAERLDDLRAGIGAVAAIEDPARMEVAHLVREAVPPLRTFAPHLVELEHAVGLAPAGVVRYAPAGDQRPGAVVHDASGLVLVHAEEDEMAGEIARLRRAADDLLVDPAGERLEAPARVSHRINKEIIR